MNKKVLTLIAVIFINYGFFCQTDYKFYRFPKEIPKSYIINAADTYQKLKATTLAKGASKEEIDRYCERISFGKQNLFYYGEVYFNWNELEDYLNTILRNILPDSLKNHNELHVYPARKADFNAFAISDGSIFFNVGYLSEMPNEAALASTMGHELTHYLRHDTYHSFFTDLEKIKTQKKVKSYDEYMSRKTDKASYERSQESYADSVGYIFANNGNYNVANSLLDFYLVLMQEKIDETNNKHRRLVNVGSKRDSTLSNKMKLWAYLLNDHPVAVERIAMIHRFLSAHSNKGKGDFIQSKDLFFKLRQQARYEKLYILMEENNYYDCILSAFTYYLQSPDDKYYSYYLLEGLRKMIYTEDKQTLEKGFLTQHLKGLFKYNKGILHNIRYLSPDSNFVQNVKVKELADTSKIEFENYYQAYDYFQNDAFKRNMTEAYLIAAQRFYDDDDSRKAYCDKYLSFPDAKHKEYAIAVKNKALYKNLQTNKKELFLANSLQMWDVYPDSKYLRYIKSNQETPKYFNQLKQDLKKKFPAKEFILFDSLKVIDFDRYFQLQRILEAPYIFGMRAFQKKEESKTTEIYFDDSFKDSTEHTLNDLFLLETSFWEFFKENNLRSVEYCNTQTFSNFTKKKLYEDMWKNFYFTGYFKFDTQATQKLFEDSEQRSLKNLDPKSYSKSLIQELEGIEESNKEKKK